MPREGKASVLDKKAFEWVLAIAQRSINATRNLTLVYFSFYLGLRAKEMASLCLGDVLDYEDKILSEVKLLRHMTKGNDAGTIYLTNKKLRNALETYLAERRATHEVMTRESPLFLSQKGSFFSPNAMQQVFAKLYRDAGIVGASSHSGRRTFATMMHDKGVSLKVLQVLMRHKSIKMTAEYVDHNPNTLKKVIEGGLW